MSLENELMNLTCKLISFKTVTGNSNEISKCFAFIKKYLPGFCAQEFSFNGIKSIIISKKKKTHFKILLLGHVDVVPANENQFKAKVKNKKIFGRGSGDMKSGIAVALLVMKNLARDDIALILTSDEEIGGFNGAKFLAKKLKAEFGISLEPSDEKISVGNKGVLNAVIQARGVSGHASQPWAGENAVDKIIKAYVEIKKLFPVIKKNSSFNKKWVITCNLGIIKSNANTLNRIPDFAEFDLDIRFTEKDNIKKLLKKIKFICNKFDCSVKFPVSENNVCISKSNKFVKLLKKASKSCFSKEFGGSDNRFFNLIGIPAIDFGPKANCIHGPSERTSIKSVVWVYNSLIKFFEKVK